MQLSDIDAEKWKRLSPAQRVKQCRLIAEESRHLGEVTSGEMKRSYLELAARWDDLANAINKESTEGH